MLQDRASTGNQRGLIYLPQGEGLEQYLSFADLDRQARQVARQLMFHSRPGDRAALLFGEGPDIVVAFFGALYAGLITVPLPPPQPNQPPEELQALLSDAQAVVLLTSIPLTASVSAWPSEMLLPIITLETVLQDTHVQEDGWAPFPAQPETLASLLYTSGSTTRPRGVMLSHGHLIRRLAALDDAVRGLEYLTDGPTVSWMPLYHIWGLGAAVLQPMYLDIQAIVLPTSKVIERPVRWLQAISQYRATSSGAPNFAFQACIDAVSTKEAAALDLRCWQIAPLGAETIRLETLDQFAARYEAAGFQRRAFAITYGLSEGMATFDARQTDDKPVHLRVDRAALEEGRVINSSSAQAGQTIVSCGLPIPGQRLKIVDPEQQSEVGEDMVGEIWLGGSLVADGYWNQGAQTEQVFHAHLISGEGPFLRTGDLGSIHEGELYVTGRLKDILIIHGKNLYAIDLEHTAEQAHPALMPTASIAFSVQVALEEQLVLVLEIRPEYETANVAEITAAVRRRIGDRFQLSVNAVVLVESGSLPRTQTGKLQRQRCRELYLSSSDRSVNP